MNYLPIAIAITAVFAGLFLGWHIRGLIARIDQLEKSNTELQAIAERRKLPYPAQAGLEDAIAIVIDILNSDEAAQAYRSTRIQQLAERIKQVRTDPQHYDIHQPDQPPRKGK